MISPFMCGQPLPLFAEGFALAALASFSVEAPQEAPRIRIWCLLMRGLLDCLWSWSLVLAFVLDARILKLQSLAQCPVRPRMLQGPAEKASAGGRATLR